MAETIFYFQAWQNGREFKGSRTDTDFCKFAEWYHQKREQERQGPAPDRDELAMTMPVDHLPIYVDSRTFKPVCDMLGIECNPADPESYIKARLEYAARCRYMYADAMLKARKV